MKQWYERLFENYAKTYDNETFTRGTLGECDFLEEEFNHNKSLRILDIGCGTGRHAIELAKRGYSVTGIDLSENQINQARKKAEKENLSIDFQVHDARKLPFEAEFDAAIMLCEGGFPLMETDEMNYEILKNAALALQTPGKFIFTTLNGLFPLINSTEAFCAADKEAGNAEYSGNTFDIMTFRDYSTTTVIDDNGNKVQLECNERFYIPPEIRWLLKSLGFHTIEIFGAKLGTFSRQDSLGAEDFEMLVIAEK